MQVYLGDIFDGLYHSPKGTVLMFTANNVIKGDGSLVMGAGIAKDVKNRWPGIDLLLGKLIKSAGSPDYGIVIHDNPPCKNAWLDGKYAVGAFQVKRHYSEPALLSLIKQSTGQLRAEALANPDTVFHLNYPGIGLGKLSVSQVEPLIAVLPDNVHVWRFR